MSTSTLSYEEAHEYARKHGGFHHPSWGWCGPNKPAKGLAGGACNRTQCQQEPATHYNAHTRKFYCEPCAIDINKGAVAAGLKPFCDVPDPR